MLLIYSYAPGIHAQITLKPYEDKSIGGYESIIFEYEEQSSSAPGQQVQTQKVKKEFDIEANNPFNELPFAVKKTKPNGSRVYQLGANEKASYLQNLNVNTEMKDYGDVDLTADSHWFADVKDSYAAIAYNLFLYGPYGDVAAERVSTIKIVKR